MSNALWNLYANANPDADVADFDTVTEWAADRIAALEADRDDYKDRWEQTGCTRHRAMEAAIKVNKELLKDITELKAENERLTRNSAYSLYRSQAEWTEIYKSRAIKAEATLRELEALKEQPDEVARDEDGDLTMPVKVEWLLHHMPKHYRDGACIRCYPESKYVIKGFLCYRHRAEEFIKEPDDE